MSETTPASPSPASVTPAKKSARRRGIVLVAVLVVVASLSLGAYHYSDSMISEYKASDNAHRSAQARRFAESGIHYAAAMLSVPSNYNNILLGNPWYNPGAFQGVQVTSDPKMNGFFTLIGPPSLDDGADITMPYYGVSDEAGKINLNALMKLDPTGQALYKMLMLLPYMDMYPDIAASIVAWMGGSYGITQGGATDSYYEGLTPPYRCKNGPIDSIDELLLVCNMTRDLLYGSDYNRNGVQDSFAEVGPYGFYRGWSAYLTCYSREQNSDPTGKYYVYLNNADLQQMYNELIAANVSQEMATYIVMFRQNGVLLGNPPKNATVADVGSFTIDYTTKGTNSFKTIYDMIGTSVSVSTPGPPGKDGKPGKSVTTVYQCPLNDAATMADQLPKLYACATFQDPAKMPELIPRINMLTASSVVLATLPGLQATDIQNILAVRPKLNAMNAPDPIFTTPAWLYTEAKVSLSTLKKLDTLITNRTQVYRVQSVGYFDSKGPTVRLEAVIDANAGRPRILYWRDLSELGSGMSDPNSNQPAGQQN